MGKTSTTQMKTAKGENGGFRFDAIDRAVAILQALERAEQPLSLAAIAREVGLGQPTTSRYLASLAGHGLVDRVEGASYVLGISLYLLGQKALDRREVRVIARPHIEQLHAQFNETVSLAVWIKQELIVVDCIEAEQVLRQGASVGVRNPWHASALGKSILAWLKNDEIERLLPVRNLQRYTRHTLKNRDAVLLELPKIRAKGYALDNEEANLGGRCVGASILDSGGAPFAAISISGPTTRIADEKIALMGKCVANAASNVSRAMGFSNEAVKSRALITAR